MLQISLLSGRSPYTNPFFIPTQIPFQADKPRGRAQPPAQQGTELSRESVERLKQIYFASKRTGLTICLNEVWKAKILIREINGTLKPAAALGGWEVASAALPEWKEPRVMRGRRGQLSSPQHLDRRVKPLIKASTWTRKISKGQSLQCWKKSWCFAVC